MGHAALGACRLPPTLAETTAPNFTAPLFATVLATVLLGEKIRLRRTLALAIGFAGAIVILPIDFFRLIWAATYIAYRERMLRKHRESG